MSKDLKDIKLGASFKDAAQRIGHYKSLLFFLFVAAIYGFIIYRINVLSGGEADTSTATTTSSAKPHIDPAVVKKIQDLQDNSVSVQSLFEQSGRDNPFQE